MAMRSKFLRFEHNSGGYRAILQSGPVAGLLKAKGESVAGSIESRIDRDRYGDWEVIVSSRVGATRARTLVSGVPLRVEQEQAILGTSIDAGRG